MRTFGIPSPLFAKADDSSGGGGGGDEPKAALSDEQVKAIGGLISGALKSEGKRLIASAIKDELKELKLGETIAAEVAKLKPEPEPAPKPGEKKPDPHVAALETKVSELTEKLKAEAAERQKAVEDGKAKDARAALRSALTPLLRDGALDVAVDVLFDARKRVSLDEQGNPLIKVTRKDYTGADEVVDMPLKDGLAHWIKSDEGKFFSPPPGASGPDPKGGGGPRRVNLGGDGMPKYESPATTDAEKVRRAAEKEAAIRAKYPHLT